FPYTTPFRSVGVVEDVTAPGLTQVVDLEVVAGLDERAGALREHLDLEVGGGAAVGEGQGRLLAEGSGRGGQVRGHELPLVGSGRFWPSSIVPDSAAHRRRGPPAGALRPTTARRTLPRRRPPFSGRGACAPTRAAAPTGSPDHPRAR